MSVKVKWDADKVIGIVQKGGEKAVRACAQMLLDEAKKQVPKNHGDLERSGAIDSDGLSATVSFDTPYAVRQHEETRYKHQRGRKAKYLEDPCNDPEIRARMLDYFKDLGMD